VPGKPGAYAWACYRAPHTPWGLTGQAQHREPHQWAGDPIISNWLRPGRPGPCTT